MLTSVTLQNGRTPYQEALLAGNDEMAEYRLADNARKIDLDEKERFASTCVGGRREEASAMLQRNSKLMDQLGKQLRSEVMDKAIGSGRKSAIRLVAELGFDLNAMIHDRTPMHVAAWRNDVETIKLLLELGADPEIRDGIYDGAPLNWAEFNQQREATDYLRTIAVASACSCTGAAASPNPIKLGFFDKVIVHDCAQYRVRDRTAA